MATGDPLERFLAQTEPSDYRPGDFEPGDSSRRSIEAFVGRMTETYWKAVRLDGTDFWTGTVRWLPKSGPLRRSRIVRHPTSTRVVKGDHATSLAVSTDPTELPGAGWPMRLCRVEQVGSVIITDTCKRQSLAWRVVEEVDPAIRFGPQGSQVAALIARAGALTAGEADRLPAAWAAAGDAAWAAEAAWAAGAAARSAQAVRLADVLGIEP